MKKMNNALIGFILGYLYAIVFTYLHQKIENDFNYAYLHASAIYTGLFFGWIFAIPASIAVYSKLNITRLSAGLLTGSIIFYIVMKD